MEDGQDLEGSRARVRFSDAKFVGGGGVVVVVAAAAGGGGGKRLITASTWNSILVSVVLYSFQCSAWLTYCGCWYVPIKLHLRLSPRCNAVS